MVGMKYTSLITPRTKLGQYKGYRMCYSRMARNASCATVSVSEQEPRAPDTEVQPVSDSTDIAPTFPGLER